VCAAAPPSLAGRAVRRLRGKRQESLVVRFFASESSPRRYLAAHVPHRRIGVPRRARKALATRSLDNAFEPPRRTTTPGRRELRPRRGARRTCGCRRRPCAARAKVSMRVRSLLSPLCARCRPRKASPLQDSRNGGLAFVPDGIVEDERAPWRDRPPGWARRIGLPDLRCQARTVRSAATTRSPIAGP
jgi:hypothetical protein